MTHPGADVASAPGGMEFLYAVGFEPMHGHLVNQRQASSVTSKLISNNQRQ